MNCSKNNIECFKHQHHISNRDLYHANSKFDSPLKSESGSESESESENIASILKHPCTKLKNGCKYGHTCVLQNHHIDTCQNCLRGVTHLICKGVSPLLHPCERVWGKGNCKYGKKCALLDIPQAWCVFCLMNREHPVTCSGLKPPLRFCKSFRKTKTIASTVIYLQMLKNKYNVNIIKNIIPDNNLIISLNLEKNIENVEYSLLQMIEYT
jgi:hypothetical protein